MSIVIKREKLCMYLDQTFGAFREGICVSDADGTILYLNSRHEELANLKSGEILGKSAEKTCENGIFDFVVNPEVVRTKKPVTGVQSVCTGRHLFLDGYPVFDDKGEVTLVVTFIRDMTAMQELKKRVSAQEKMLEAYQFLQSSNEIKYPQILDSDRLKSAYSRLVRVADTDATVLLLGETGVGKDVFAKKLHALSARSERAFIKADCACIPENLIESEFFGYVPGAFSGASAKGKVGYFEKADSGTLFLDEIGELPLQLQAKLLRVLQDREVVRVGATTPRKVDVRIVAATNKDLEEEVEAGRFRQDLFYRLKVAMIRLPPLRERREDILPLATNFLRFYTHKYNRNMALSPEVKEALQNYSWPGNVREIENLILSLIVTCEKDIAEPEDLPPAISPPRPKCSDLRAFAECTWENRSLQEIMEDLEKKVLTDALDRFGSVTKAAERLKVDRTTIFRKLKKLQIRR